jgi:hypothetical protein
MNSDIIYANTQAALPQFNNPSNLAIIKAVAIANGIALDNIESEQTNTINIILNAIQTLNYGNVLYYIQKALNFEYDTINDIAILPTQDPVTREFKYNTPDPLKLVIAQASLRITTSEDLTTETLKLFVATTNSDGGLIALATNMFTSFKNYMKNNQIIGIPLPIVTSAGNTLNCTIEVSFYNNYDQATLIRNVETALSNYSKSFISNGNLYLTLLSKYVIDNVSGVRNVYIHDFTISEPDNTFVEDSVLLTLGYFRFGWNPITNAGFGNITIALNATSGTNNTPFAIGVNDKLLDNNGNLIGVVATVPTSTSFTLVSGAAIAVTASGFMKNNINYIPINANV